MPPNSAYTLEICVDGADGVTAAAPFADRIELCSGLDIGGLTPDPGLMEFAARSGIETHVLIRPRSGDFELSDADLQTACASISAVRDYGLSGVVLGAERGGRLDLAALEAMGRAADGLALTLHRVIDVVSDPLVALEDAIALGFTRVLTSGGAVRAVEGVATLNALYQAANARIEVMAGSGINSANLPDLLAQTEISSFHASCSAKAPLSGHHRSLGFGEYKRGFDAAEAGRLVTLLGGSAKDGPLC